MGRLPAILLLAAWGATAPLGAQSPDSIRTVARGGGATSKRTRPGRTGAVARHRGARPRR